MSAGDEETFATGAREWCITVLAGQVDVQVHDARYTALSSRASVFKDCSPTTVCVPPGRSVKISARGVAELGLSSVPARVFCPSA